MTSAKSVHPLPAPAAARLVAAAWGGAGGLSAEPGGDVGARGGLAGTAGAATFIITGGQDNIQAVAGQMLAVFSELGFVFPPFPFIAHSRGWAAEDMERNVHAVQESESLRTAAHELVMRAIETARHLHESGHFARAGRKASPLRAAPEPGA